MTPLQELQELLSLFRLHLSDQGKDTSWIFSEETYLKKETYQTTISEPKAPEPKAPRPLAPEGKSLDPMPPKSLSPSNFQNKSSAPSIPSKQMEKEDKIIKDQEKPLTPPLLFSKWEKKLEELFPEMKQVDSQWTEKILSSNVLIVIHDSQEEINFFSKVKEALDSRSRLCHLISLKEIMMIIKMNLFFPSLMLILSSPASHDSLKPFLQKNGERECLSQIPLIKTDSPLRYNQDVNLKRELWQKLQSHLKI